MTAKVNRAGDTMTGPLGLFGMLLHYRTSGVSGVANLTDCGVEMIGDNSGYELPDATTCPGQVWMVKGMTAVNQVVTPHVAGQKIDGADNYTFTVAKQVRWFQSDGANFKIIAGYL
jgi:hypothetical protein